VNETKAKRSAADDIDAATLDGPLPTYRGLMTAAGRMRRDRDAARLLSVVLTVLLAIALGMRACERFEEPSLPAPAPSAPEPLDKIRKNREPVGSEGAGQGWPNGSRRGGGDSPDLPISAVSSVRPARESISNVQRSTPKFQVTANFNVTAPAIKKLLAAIRAVESSGDDRAVGDSGRSLGPYQISRAYWLDGGGDPARYRTDVWSPESCRPVVLGYWRRYAASALAAGDAETLARIHNGGPRGARIAATRKYWSRVRSRLNREDES